MKIVLLIATPVVLVLIGLTIDVCHKLTPGGISSHRSEHWRSLPMLNKTLNINY